MPASWAGSVRGSLQTSLASSTASSEFRWRAGTARWQWSQKRERAGSSNATPEKSRRACSVRVRGAVQGGEARSVRHGLHGCVQRAVLAEFGAVLGDLLQRRGIGRAQGRRVLHRMQVRHRRPGGRGALPAPPAAAACWRNRARHSPPPGHRWPGDSRPGMASMAGSTCSGRMAEKGGRGSSTAGDCRWPSAGFAEKSVSQRGPWPAQNQGSALGCRHGPGLARRES